MVRNRYALLMLACVIAGVAPAPVSAQTMDTASLIQLQPGTRIRAAGEAIRHVSDPTTSDILLLPVWWGLFRSRRVTGTLISATADSVSFAEARRGALVAASWASLQRLDVHGGYSPAAGALKGAALGAAGGLVALGLVKLVFAPLGGEIEKPVMLPLGFTALGAAVGAATMGTQWRQVYPPR